MRWSRRVPAPAQALPGGLPLIRDAEIEQLLRDYTQPILRAAGLAQQNIQVVIINDRSFNAFVMDGRRIFVNAGALMESQTPNQIIGVLAHETGHIAGGHLAQAARRARQCADRRDHRHAARRRRDGGRRARGGSDAAARPARRPHGAAEHDRCSSLLSYQRQQEEQADRAGVKFLTATGQSAEGHVRDLQALCRPEPVQRAAGRPLSAIASDAGRAHRGAGGDRAGTALLGQEGSARAAGAPRHDARQAVRLPRAAGYASARRYPPSDTSLPARYARAISAYRHGDLRDALAQIDALIQAQPNNPYFYELKGQALLEAGAPAEAIAPLRRAVSLAPNPALIQVMLGQALVATSSRR